MAKIDVKDYLSELKKEHQEGYAQGYADAWIEIEKMVKQSSFEAGCQVAINRKTNN